MIDEMRDAALATGNPSVVALADHLRELHVMQRSSPLPPPSGGTHRDLDNGAGRAETAVTAFLRNERQPQRRARHALEILGQYATSSEGYLFLVRAKAPRFAASLDERSPPDGLEAVLATLPANDSSVATTVDIPGGEPLRYNVFPLQSRNTRVGLAVLRQLDDDAASLPHALLAEIGAALCDAPD